MPSPRRRGVTVVMPTYNGADYISAALHSLCRPAERPDEVIVVDDGSSDATLHIARSFNSRLPIRVLRPGPRHNWMAMTNLGLGEASCEWTAILHQDDLWLPGRLERLRPALAGPSSLLLMDARFIDGTGRTVGRWRLPRSARSVDAGPTASICAALYVQNWIAVPSTTFRTDAALAIGGLDERLWYTADWDLWLKLSQQGGVACVPHYGSAFRVHGSSQSVIGSHDIAAFRHQLTEVQRRHHWAALKHPDPALIERAGSLSTETNVLLAGHLHHGPGRYGPWLSVLAEAGMRGVKVYLTNSAITSRVLARLGLALRSRLTPPGGPTPPAG